MVIMGRLLAGVLLWKLVGTMCDIAVAITSQDKLNRKKANARIN